MGADVADGLDGGGGGDNAAGCAHDAGDFELETDGPLAPASPSGGLPKLGVGRGTFENFSYSDHKGTSMTNRTSERGGAATAQGFSNPTTPVRRWSVYDYNA